MSIENTKKHLKQKIAKNEFGSVFILLRDRIEANSAFFDNVILIEREYGNLRDDEIKGILSYEQKRITLSSISGRLILLINSLSLVDLRSIDNSEEQDIKGEISNKLRIEELTFEEIYQEFKEKGKAFVESSDILSNTVSNKNEAGIKYRDRLIALQKKRSFDKKLYGVLLDKLMNVFKEYGANLERSAEKINESNRAFFEISLLMFEKGYSLDPSRYALEELEEILIVFKDLQDLISKLRIQFIDQMHKDHETNLKLGNFRKYQKIGELIVQSRGSLITSLTRTISNLLLFQDGINQLLLRRKTYSANYGL